jgi:hypothetical protein
MAHESRTIVGADPTQDVYEIIFGFSVEPAFEDSFNGGQIFLFYDDGSSDGEAVNTRNGDIVNFTNVEVMYLDQQTRPDDPSFSSHVVRTYAFDLNDPTQLPRIAFGSTNEYKNHFRPARDGAYAIRVAGSIQDVNHDPDDEAGTNTPTGLTTFDETFSCQGGTLDVDPATGQVLSRFNCVVDITSFPGPSSNGYINNAPERP